MDVSHAPSCADVRVGMHALLCVNYNEHRQDIHAMASRVHTCTQSLCTLCTLCSKYAKETLLLVGGRYNMSQRGVLEIEAQQAGTKF